MEGSDTSSRIGRSLSGKRATESKRRRNRESLPTRKLFALAYFRRDLLVEYICIFVFASRATAESNIADIAGAYLTRHD